jgi:hypothetical protein
MQQSEEWITTPDASRLTGYKRDYLAQLARDNRVVAEKRGRDWWIERESLLAYKAEMDSLGQKRHDPWRWPGRGRRRKAHADS